MKLIKRSNTSKHTSPKAKLDPKDYEALGRMLANIYESGYINKNQTYKMSFLKGIVTGLGGVVGATIVVGLLVWALSLFGEVPLIESITEPIQDTLNTPRR